MLSKLNRIIAHSLTGIRVFQKRKVISFANNIKNKKILELGSGKKVNGKFYYSFKDCFDESNKFIMSDVQEEYGHTLVDVTKMKFEDEFDIILCLNVLEHVYKYDKAIKNIYKALKKGGVAVIAVPAFYPLHDEPGDYWRFTEHSLRILLKDFEKIKLIYKGKREFPFSYYIEAKK